MKHIPGPWKLSPSGLKIRKDTKGDETLVICNMSAPNYIPHKTRIANALRIVECVNAMEGIENPHLLRKYWDEQMFNEVKSNYVKTMLMSKEELQKLGEQYANQEETPYVETTTGEKVRQKHTAAAQKYIGLTIKRNEQDQPKDGPTKADIEEQEMNDRINRINEAERLKFRQMKIRAEKYAAELAGNITQESAGQITHVAFADSKKDIEQVIFDMRKYMRLKEVIENMLDRLDAGAELTLTKDSIIVHCLREEIK